MIGHRHSVWIGVIALGLPGLCLAADRFPTEARRQGFLQALAAQDARYDPQEKMLRAPFSSPGYHTTLTGGTVHRTRESLKYAVALLDAGDSARLERAQQILERVIGLQDQNPSSRTYGIWPWFLEEPLAQMSPPDWNWADFCGTQLLQVALDHDSRLSVPLSQKVRESILHAARSIKRRNVGPGYTNIALMGTYVTLVAGEQFNDKELLEYGQGRLKRFYKYCDERGSFSEYNSPTYTRVAIEEISRMRAHVQDPAARAIIDELNTFAWHHLARRFHAPTEQWAGPHSRSYATLLRPSVLAFIQRGTGSKVKFVPTAQVWKSIDAQRIPLSCPGDLFEFFTALPQARQEVEAFVINEGREHDVIGTTYLHDDFTLGSVNLGDLWNQRRPLVGYWNTPGGVAALRLRCLHDDYDYSSASLFTVQDQGDIFGAVVFATDRGDTHLSLDRIRNATIEAGDLRVRLQFEGAIADLALPDEVVLDEPVAFTSGPISGEFYCPYAVFDEYPISIETGRDAEMAWIDIVLYQGLSRSFNFHEIEEAAVLFTLSLHPARDIPTQAEPAISMGIAYGVVPETQTKIRRRKWLWQRTNASPVSLTVPLTPLPTAEQKKAAAAHLASIDPWEALQ
jgi:hypothetical protein